MQTPFIFYILSLLEFGLGDGSAQIVLNSSTSKADEIIGAKKIAIVGAGIAGASAAYHLSNQYSKTTLDITLYEANDHVGGRVQLAKVYNGAYGSQRVETGAHSFYTDDKCIQSMIDETGLRQKLEVQYPKKVQVGVWDGTSFLLRDENDLKVRTWRDWIRYTWKYGRSVHRLCNLITVKLPPFQRLLGALETVNRNVAQVIDQLGLTAEKNTHAQSYLRDLISPNYIRDVVEATARAWFAQDLAALN